MGISEPIYGLIGKKLGHSFSKKYFTQKFAREGITSQYELYEIPNIEDFLKLWEKYPRLKGLNVTIPYKAEVIPYLDRLAPEAFAVQAVNTIRRDKEGLIGFNSDIYGFWTSLEKFLEGHEPTKALVLGTGGAARAVAYVLEHFAKIPIITYVSRRPTSPDHISYSDLATHGLEEFSLIVNTTPLGMYPDISSAPQIPYDQLTPQHFAYDLVYNPEETQFLSMAKARGAKILNGLPMLIGQAEKSWEFWNEEEGGVVRGNVVSRP